MVYNYFRDYDPSLGRYIQSDPIGLNGGLNTFSYVASSPLSWSDSLGLYRIDTSRMPGNLNRANTDRYAAYVRRLGELGNWMRNVIANSCPMDRSVMQTQFDRWVVEVDPRIFEISHNRGDYGLTDFKTGRTTFLDLFFRQGLGFESALDPGQRFVFAHEFRHLFPENDKLPSDGTRQRLGVGNASPSPMEVDADRFARNFTNGCPCGTARW